MRSSITTLLSSALSSLLLLLLLLHSSHAQQTFLWPHPQSISWGTGPPIPLSPSFLILPPSQAPPQLLHAASRYQRLISQEKWVPVQVPVKQQSPPSPIQVQPLQSLHIAVSDLVADLQHGVDESYSIFIPDEGKCACLSAATVWGAIHGLETFSQLVLFSSASGLLIEHGVKIEDKPLFPYRGVLLDTARNFYPVKDILRTIRALSYNKLNALHWHITDSQSFPIEIATEPELARKGSYGPKFIYSRRDIRRIVKYARCRGVRIIPEIDTPGHSASWGGAYPEIVTCQGQFWWNSNEPWSKRMASEPTSGQLNPLQAKTYEVVKNVIHDVASLFPDSFYHSGADEIAPGCWKNSTDIQQYLVNGGTLNALLEKFISTTHPYITAQNKTVVYWEDVMLDEKVFVSSSILPKETTILETWLNGPLNTKTITRKGYRTIVASSDFYYLDCGHGSFLGNDTRVDQAINTSPEPSYNYGGNGGSWCAPFKSWQRIYDYDITYNLTAKEAKLVEGGEVGLWSEQSDGTVLDGLLWPRAAALAESLWSGNRGPDNKKRSAEAINRLNDWRYRMVGRGIRAGPLQPMWCLKNPNQCNQ